MDSKINDQSKTLENLGKELTKIQYDFKIKDNTSEKYWEKSYNFV